MIVEGVWKGGRGSGEKMTTAVEHSANAPVSPIDLALSERCKHWRTLADLL